MFTQQKTKIKKIISLNCLSRCLLYIGKKVRGMPISSMGVLEDHENNILKSRK